jgi:hypothetical protein
MRDEGAAAAASGGELLTVGRHGVAVVVLVSVGVSLPGVAAGLDSVNVALPCRFSQCTA